MNIVNEVASLQAVLPMSMLQTSPSDQVGAEKYGISFVHSMLRQSLDLCQLVTREWKYGLQNKGTSG